MINEITSIVEELGGETALGCPVHNGEDMKAAILEGFFASCSAGTYQYQSAHNLRLAAVRRLVYEATDCGLLSPNISSGIRRVKVARRLSVWLVLS
jgi:hypothetical protein